MASLTVLAGGRVIAGTQEGSTVFLQPDELEFVPLPSVDGYTLEYPRAGTVLHVERLRRERNELIGELTVDCKLPGRSASGRLSAGDFNLSSVRARSERARVLAERTPGLDWIGLLEELCQRVLDAERAGRPAIALRDVAKATADEDMTIDGIRLLRRHPVTFFGAGGDLKSLIALYLAGRLADDGFRVLYADWEFSAEDHRDRLERLAGDDMPEGILYVRCERPLTAEADRLRRIVVEDRIDYVVYDSVAFACDGPPESAEVASAYFRAQRRVGTGSLNIAHVTKADGGDRSPFGSAFWHNGSRATWFVKRSEDAGGPVRVALFNRKSNVGPLSRAIGYAVSFDEGRIRFTPSRVADMADLALRLPVWQRMTELLRTGSLTAHEIATELDEKVDTVAKTARRLDGKVFTRVTGPDNVYRIGLLAREVAA